MRRAAKVDANQGIIVAALRATGCSVEPLHTVGRGVPDLLVGINGLTLPVNLLMEVKDGEKPPSARKLTPEQINWHGSWLGQKAVVESLDQALSVVELYRSTYGRKEHRISLPMRSEWRSSNVRFQKHFSNKSGSYCHTS